MAPPCAPTVTAVFRPAQPPPPSQPPPGDFVTNSWEGAQRQYALATGLGKMWPPALGLPLPKLAPDSPWAALYAAPVTEIGQGVCLLAEIGQVAPGGPLHTA